MNVIALNQDPKFSGGLAPELAAALERRFPHAMGVGHFQIRWKE